MYNVTPKIKKYTIVGLFFLAFIILYFSFYKNSFHAAKSDFYHNFQMDSEALVTEQIKKVNDNFQHDFSNLGNYWIEEKKFGGSINDIPLIININNLEKTIRIPNEYYKDIKNAERCLIEISNQQRFIKKIISKNDYVELQYYGELLDLNNIKTISINLNKQIHASEYTSQYGLQGKIYSYGAKYFGLSVKTFHRTNCALLALVVLILIAQIAKIFSKSFAVIFFVSILFSPWIVSFARNLYWITFSWFLPAVFAWMLYFCKSIRFKCMMYAGIFFSSCFKCLSGYEYFSSVLIFAVAPFVFFALMAENRKDVLSNIRQALFICLIGTFGFIVAILMHAYLRSGGSISSGISTIWHNDVLRRTFGGNVKDFAPVYANSLKASAWSVIRIYFSDWQTNVISLPVIKWFSFKALGMLAILALIFSYRRNKTEARYCLSLIIAFCLPALSWYMLGKSHSFIHIHMNYVLWYMGGVAAILNALYRDIVARWHNNMNSM